MPWECLEDYLISSYFPHIHLWIFESKKEQFLRKLSEEIRYVFLFALLFFLEKTDRFSKVCVIFDKLMGVRECRDCISSYETDDSCVCNQENGECRIDSDNFIMFVLLLQPVTTYNCVYFFRSCYLKREEAAWLDFFLDCNSVKEL